MKTLFRILLVAALLGSAGAQTIKLPQPQKSGGMPLMAALAQRATSRAFEARELPDQQLADMLWAGFGINRADGKRTAPSALDQRATDIYVLLKRGAYIYNAQSNQLDLVIAADLRRWGATQDFATNAPVTLVFIADYARMGKGSNDSKRAMANLNAGYISQNVYLFCASAGLATGARASVDRKALGEKLSLRADQEIILAQSVGYPKSPETAKSGSRTEP